MSLTIFIDRKSREVGILEWFRDPKFRSLSYPDAPLHRLSWDQFRTEGLKWVREHFIRFAVRYIYSDNISKTITPEDMRKYLKQQKAVSVRQEASGEIRMNPLGFRRYNLGSFDAFDSDRWKILPSDCTEELFWKTFDDVLEDAP
ncbi:MAG TPA: hypothetical protein VMF06_05710 [Candidatus Limnocylindria bacterium]|jgi:hypothetical protein|nr:hypothetical protein [Candidatus Limnocylindria bacterium]